MRRQRPPEPFAVIDLGSNSIRMVVYDGLTRSPVTRFNERRMCGLRREVARSGKLGAEGKACALEALTRFMAIARGVGCQEIDIVATAAMRQAKDGKAFITQATKALRHEITVLSGPEEAHFGALGVTCGFYDADGVMADLGGGSVEFARVPATRKISDSETGLWSLPLGVLVIGEALKDGSRAQALIDQHFDAQPLLARLARGRTFYVVGGSWRALARSRMAFMDHPLRVVHGYELTPDEAVTLGRTMVDTPMEELAKLPGFPRKRVETAPAAGLMLANVVEKLGPARVVFSATGVREGRLFARLKRSQRLRDPLVAAAEDLGRLANRDPRTGQAMQTWTDGLVVDETKAQRRLRLAICHVSDSSWREHPDTRAREAFLRLVQYPFLGIDHRERVALAYATFIRYDGHRDDPIVTPITDLIGSEDKRHAEIVGEALELGYRISAGAPEIIDRCELSVAGNTLVLMADHETVGSDDEAIARRLAAVAVLLGFSRTALKVA